ncbi:MAG: hypothetical protein KA465_02590, partial [Anaerolineaceae bacterium]|nr:hypothetical protein [Anaerolineaceae bacterium]
RMAPLIIPVTMNAILSSEDIADAMDLRGFGQGKRTWLYELRYHRWDYIVLGFSALLAIGGLVASYGFHMGDFVVPQFFYNLFA